MIKALVQEDIKKEVIKIPDYLIREEIDGKPYFYKGYKSVLSKKKTLADIMGASTLQSFFIEILMNFLFQNLGRKKYRYMTNEVGGHLKKGTNLSFDLAVFDKKVMTFDKINEHYADVPPKMIFEVDVKIDVEDENAIDYMNTKTEKLLNFGTELVVWVLTKQEKLIVARPNQKWEIIKWTEDVELIEDIVLNIGQLIKEEEED